jgi:hypothetical protein
MPIEAGMAQWGGEQISARVAERVLWKVASMMRLLKTPIRIDFSVIPELGIDALPFG